MLSSSKTIQPLYVDPNIEQADWVVACLRCDLASPRGASGLLRTVHFANQSSRSFKTCIGLRRICVCLRRASTTGCTLNIRRRIHTRLHTWALPLQMAICMKASASSLN